MRPEQRVELAVELSEAVRQIALDGIRRRHPRLDDAQIHREWLCSSTGPGSPSCSSRPPRDPAGTTNDIDLVIDPDAASLERFVAGLDRRRFYVGDFRGALERRDQFNVIDTTTAWKVGLIVRKGRRSAKPNSPAANRL